MTMILIVDDDKGLVNLVFQSLIFEKYLCEIAYDGAEARRKLADPVFGLIILDWQLPDATGPDLLQEYRRAGGSAPVLMLTGKDAIEDKEVGLDSGADDYLTKPFSVKELTARIRALLRRPQDVQDNELRAGDLVLDSKQRKVDLNGRAVVLLPKEFQLLEFLMRHQNNVFSAEELLNRVWSSESESTLEATKSTMKRLRKKVDPDGIYIHTKHGVGFIFQAES
jgi:DNA-binding response OmpR family regulator